MSYPYPSPGHPPPRPVKRKPSTPAIVASSVFAAVAVLVAVALVAVGLTSNDDDPRSGGTLDLGALLTTTTTTAPEPVAYSPEQLVATFGDAVWRVRSQGCDEIWTGTAFAIDEHHLVTNHHVVANSTRPRLEGRDGTSITGTVVGWSERPDVAVIKVDQSLDTWLSWAPTDELREGQSILAIGYPVPDTVFTATPGSILSFQARTGVREAVRTNAALDRGNSGGPALDQYGRVVGVVTEMAANVGGLQLVPLVFTHDALSDLIDEFIEDPDEPTVRCAGVSVPPSPPDDDPVTDGANTYGDDPILDALWDECEAGDMVACDDLWWGSPSDSEYEAFADTCGWRNEPGAWCSDEYTP